MYAEHIMSDGARRMVAPDLTSLRATTKIVTYFERNQLLKYEHDMGVAQCDTPTGRSSRTIVSHVCYAVGADEWRAIAAAPTHEQWQAAVDGVLERAFASGRARDVSE